MTDYRSEARHRQAVIGRSKRNPRRLVMPADWRERRALKRMQARGDASPLSGFPDVWEVHPQ